MTTVNIKYVDDDRHGASETIHGVTSSTICPEYYKAESAHETWIVPLRNVKSIREHRS